MRRSLACLLALTLAAGLAFTIVPTASAADLSGRWKTASLKMDGVGYKMTTAAADSPANAYSVVLRFRYQDGRTGPRIKAGMVTNGSKAYLLLNGKGSLADASNPNIMKGSIGQDGSLFFATCYKQLTFAVKKTADKDCLFQEVPS